MSIQTSAIGFRTSPTTFSYSWKDLALYALGIGAKASELDYLYEQRGPKSFPTFAVVPATEHLFQCLTHAGIPVQQVVHHAQSVTSHLPLPSQAVLRTSAEISAIYDLKRFAQVIVKTESSLEDNTRVVETQWSIIVRDMGGFGGKSPPRSDDPTPPKGVEPVLRFEEPTSPEQAILYRLSGDTNPLHIDPELARSVGFERGPILHGLCTFGFAARAIVRGFCQNDAAKLKHISGRFQKPVWPGETLVTEVWQVDGRLVFQTLSKERAEVVLSQGWARIDGSSGA